MTLYQAWIAMAPADQALVVNVVTSIATLAAAIAALGSARSTARSVKEMREARFQYSRPHLVIQVPDFVTTVWNIGRSYRFSDGFKIEVANVGAGPALDVKVELILDLQSHATPRPLLKSPEIFFETYSTTFVRSGIAGRGIRQLRFSTETFHLETIQAPAFETLEMSTEVADAVLAALLGEGWTSARVAFAATATSTAGEISTRHYRLAISSIQYGHNGVRISVRRAPYRLSIATQLDRCVRVLAHRFPKIERWLYRVDIPTGDDNYGVYDKNELPRDDPALVPDVNPPPRSSAQRPHRRYRKRRRSKS